MTMVCIATTCPKIARMYRCDASYLRRKPSRPIVNGLHSTSSPPPPFLLGSKLYILQHFLWEITTDAYACLIKKYIKKING